MEKFFYKKKLIGVRARFFLSGNTVLTAAEEPLQILSLYYVQGKEIVPHFHKPLRRTTTHLQECVIVIEGRIKIDLYGPDRKYFKHLYLKAGELFMLVSGGHAIHFVEDSKIFEFKNGPYKNDRVNITADDIASSGRKI